MYQAKTAAFVEEDALVAGVEGVGARRREHDFVETALEVGDIGKV